jgi:hypothetical protein
MGSIVGVAVEADAPIIGYHGVAAAPAWRLHGGSAQ